MTVGALVANAGLLWLIAAAALAGAELAVPGVFLIFLAVAAAATGVAVLALPALPLVAQLGSFAAWSIAAVAIGQRWYRNYPVNTSDPLLNDRGARLIGEVVTVVEPIVEGEGRVRVGDGEWTALGQSLPAGARATVTGLRDGKLLIKPLPPAS